jgi:hypothetical protein
MQDDIKQLAEIGRQIGLELINEDGKHFFD